jgi:hypothetical protein
VSDYNRPWHRLTISNKNAIREDVDIGKTLFTDSPRSEIYKIKKDELEKIFNKSWLDYLNSLGLEIDCVLVFKRVYPSPSEEVHVDIGSDSVFTCYALNWIIGNDSSDMVWYDPNDFINYTKKDLAVSGAYLSGTKNGLKEIGRRCIGEHFTMVRVDAPHNVDIQANRLSISLRMASKVEITSWESAVDYFKEYIINE